MSRLEDAVAIIGEFVDTFDATLIDGDRAARLVEVFTQGARFCEAGRLAAAARVEHTHAWKRDGHRSPHEWYSAQTKTSASAATTALETAKHLNDQPRLETSFRAGKISAEQAIEIAAAAHADPTAERALVAEAETSSLKRTRKSCQAVRAAAAKDPVGDRQKIHASRYFAHWTSPDGAFEGKFRITADHGAVVLAALEQERQQVFAQARADGTHEPAQAYLADAFVNLARNTLADPPWNCGGSGSYPAGAESEASTASDPTASDPTAGGPAPDPAATGCAATDPAPDQATAGRVAAEGEGDSTASATRGGEPDHGPDPDGGAPGAAEPDTSANTGAPAPDQAGAERPGRRCPACHRPPGPSRPPAVINIRVDHAALVRGHTNPGEVCEIEGIGPVPVETVRAAASDAVLRALLVKDGRVVASAPAGRTVSARLRRTLLERDRTCVVPGCDNRHHLEIHHLQPYAEGGPTTESNTARVCPFHHDQVTYGGAVLAGSPGRWSWRPPPATPDRPGDTGSAPAAPPDQAEQLAW